MVSTDVFLCYRHYGAQTAKLFKRYLQNNDFPGEVWYSDLENLGNYKNDINNLVPNSEAIVMFIDQNFTLGFLDDDSIYDCITKYEFISIVNKQLSDSPAQLFTIFLDRDGFTEEENVIFKKVLSDAGVTDIEKGINLIVQNNQIKFSTRKDYEDKLFYNLQNSLLPNEYYKSKRLLGNFYFGNIPTTVDIVLWDSERGINTDSIFFELTPTIIPFHKKVTRISTKIPFEGQNNQMISVLGFNALLTDDLEEKIIFIRYKLIQYELFYKCLKLWDDLNCDKLISEYDWRKDLYSIPNAMGLAFLVITADHKMMFTRRSKNRGIRPNEYDCSIVEGLKTISIDPNGNQYSIYDENYLEKEIYRAFLEEVCYTNAIDIKVCGLVCDKKYGQWNLIGTIHTDFTAEDIQHLHATRADTYEATYAEFIEYMEDGKPSIKKIEPYFQKYMVNGMWDMALAVWYAGLLDVGFTPKQISELTSNFQIDQ